MIVYRDVVRTYTSSSRIGLLRRLVREGRATDFLVDLGVLEQGVADARHPARDDPDETDRILRTAALEAGRAFVADEPRARARALERALQAVEHAAPGLPATLRLRPPEGYMHYALDPRAYCATATAYARDVGARAARALVLGVRSIGTSLSAVVAAAVGSQHSLTVRPHGSTGSRRVVGSRALGEEVRAAVAAGGDVLVVDEGPGATGETFACVAVWLRGIGVPADAIVVFGSRDGDLPLADDVRRAWFRSVRRYFPPTGDDRLRRIADARGWSPAENLSGGAWRARLPGGDDLPAAVHFERLKQRMEDEIGRPLVVRYAALGEELDGRLARAAELDEALADTTGVAVPGRLEPVGFGFVALPWVEGSPLSRREAARDRSLRHAITTYVRARAGRFDTGLPVDLDRWAAVLVENASEAGWRRGADLALAERRLRALPEREAVLPDGRMQPWEWIRSRDGRITKVDALDHGDGLRLPGPVDAAWDIAAASVELGLGPADTDALARACARAARTRGSTESDRGLAAAAATYRPVYAAACWGDVALAARESGNVRDAARLRAEADFYAEALGSLLASP